MAAGRGMVYWKNRIRLRDAKKHTIKAFWWLKGDLISQWIPKFYLSDESNPINPQCGKISANFYISPPHPPHPHFTHKNGGNLNTLPGWPKKNCISIDLRGAQVNEMWAGYHRYISISPGGDIRCRRTVDSIVTCATIHIMSNTQLPAWYNM